MSWFSKIRRGFAKDESLSGSPSDSLTSVRSVSSFKVQKSIGWKIRDAVAFLEKLLGPYFKKVLPNFIAAHYFYIITMAILCSIFLYPVRNEKYIDILFFSSGTVSQAGLNTVNLNDMALYQQIIIYIFCTLSTPIFIHGSLIFLRLYWFERHFDNIRETSKLNFKMRRTATLAARTQSMDRLRTMDSQRSRGSRNLNPSTTDSQVHENQTSNPSTNHIPKESPESKPTDDSSSSEFAVSNPSALTESAINLHNEQHQSGRQSPTVHVSEPSSEDEQDALPPDQRGVKVLHTEEPDTPGTDRNIKFADLPKPKRQDFQPRDVIMSISMLQKDQEQHNDQGENEGPALVIQGPAERAKNQKLASRQSSSIHFDLGNKPQQRPKAQRKRSGLRRSWLGRTSTVDRTQEDIDSVLDDEGNASDEENNQLERAQSNLQLPSSDQSGGVKFTKRSNTLDVPSNKGASFLRKSPTFEKMIKRTVRRPRGLRRRLSSFAVEDSSSGESTSDEEDLSDENSLRRQMSTNYLSWTPKIGRNSTFVDLSDQQKEELGGVEYRAVKLLAKILVIYYIGFHVLGMMFLLPWILKTVRYQSVVRESGVSLTWWGFFTPMSSFNDLGFTLTPNSMMSFRDSPYALLVCSVLIVIGNTGFPIALRFIIWILFKLSRELSLFRESLGFLLDHPRRCFTLLFPSAPTWWLLFTLVALNVIDLVLFIILDLNAEAVEDLSTGHKVLDGLFQAISTRTAGFAAINLADLHPAVQVSYCVMMYISVLPLAISIRRTNVYEEQSLGVYMGHNEGSEESDENAKATSFIGAHLRKQLSFDLWFVFLGLFIICIAEGDKIQDDSLPEFNVFQCMFEVVSAYGTVGLSLGYTNSDASFSAQFTVISKLVIIFMMIRGRHRGLPYALDRAIMLPSEKMEKRDRYQNLHAGHRLSQVETMGSTADPVIEFFKGAAPGFIRKNMRRPSFFQSRTNTGYSRSHRRNSSYVSTNPNDFTFSSNTDGNPNSRPNQDYAFKDVHFNHSDLNVALDDEGSQGGNNIEMDNMDPITPSASESVHRAETAQFDDSVDLGSRRNSNVTF